LITGAAESLARLHTGGFALVGVSNQTPLPDFVTRDRTRAMAVLRINFGDRIPD